MNHAIANLTAGCFLSLLLQSPSLSNQGTHLPDGWRNDYQTLTQAQFIEKRGITLFNAIQKGCDSNLICEWEKPYGHGTVQHIGFFIYDYQGCSSDPQYFPHEPIDDGVTCATAEVMP